MSKRVRDLSLVVLMALIAACEARSSGGGGAFDGGDDSAGPITDTPLIDAPASLDAPATPDAPRSDALVADAPRGDGAAGACGAAPVGVTAEAIAAFEAVNAARVAAGSPCAALVPTLDTAAERHCAYYAANGAAPMCRASPHVEVMGCASFFAAQFNERVHAAGYTGNASSENMHFVGDPRRAVQGWLDTVYHRYPVLDPWTRDLGYGRATGCDTMDFGTGAATPNSTVAVYPFPGQTGVPTSFGGAESPTPPAPPGGWPAGFPISVFHKGTLSAFTITRDGASTPLATQTIPRLSYQGNATFIYANSPLARGARYNVHVAGYNGAPFVRDWSFTTAP